MEFNAFNVHFRIYIIDGGQAEWLWLGRSGSKKYKLARKLSS